MSKKLFVGGLSWNTTDSELQQAFEACGSVTEAKVITDRETGRSRGFGFVTFEDEGSAGRAIEELNGSTLDAAPDADVLVVAHRGLEGLANATDLLNGSVVGAQIEVRIWRVSADEIPRGEARRRWLFDWWKRVDDFVGGAE